MRRFEFWSNLAVLALCLAMALHPLRVKAQAESSRVAVLESRSDQIDAHLRSTDATVQRLWDTVNAQGLQLSEMQGEERAAFAIITLLTAGNFVVQLGRRRKEDKD